MSPLVIFVAGDLFKLSPVFVEPLHMTIDMRWRVDILESMTRYRNAYGVRAVNHGGEDAISIIVERT